MSSFSARLVVRFPFSHCDRPKDGARLNAFNSGKLLFIFPFKVVPSIVELLMIKMLHEQGD